MPIRQIYQDENIEIRIATELEAQLHIDAIRDSVKEIGTWEGWCTQHYGIEDSRKHLVECEEKRHRGVEYNFCLFERKSGLIVGAVSVNRINTDYKFGNVGYWIRTGFTGKSLATIAAKAAVRFAFNTLGLTRVEIVAMKENQRSRRVAEKLGAVSEGLHRNRLYYHGQPRDAWMYSLIPSDVTD